MVNKIILRPRFNEMLGLRDLQVRLSVLEERRPRPMRFGAYRAVSGKRNRLTHVSEKDLRSATARPRFPEAEPCRAVPVGVWNARHAQPAQRWRLSETYSDLRGLAETHRGVRFSRLADCNCLGRPGLRPSHPTSWLLSSASSATRQSPIAHVRFPPISDIRNSCPTTGLLCSSPADELRTTLPPPMSPSKLMKVTRSLGRTLVRRGTGPFETLAAPSI